MGGSISFAPEGEGAAAKWLGDDTRHMLAELTPVPDQVTIAINSNQMNICELLLSADDVAGTSLALPAYQAAYREMTIPSGPGFVEEHLRRLTAAGIQPHFMLGDVGQLETVERLMRRGVYTGPLVLNWVAIGGGSDGPNPYNMMEFIRRTPQTRCCRSKASCATCCRSPPWPSRWACTCAAASRTTCGVARASASPACARSSSWRASRAELHRAVASGEEARRVYRLGEHYRDADGRSRRWASCPTAAAPGFAAAARWPRHGPGPLRRRAARLRLARAT